MLKAGRVILLSGLCSLLQAGDAIPTELMGKIVASLAKLTGSPKRVACSDGSITRALVPLGLKVEGDATVAYCTSESETIKAYAAKKVVITNDLNLLPKGGSIAIVAEDGKPSIYLHLRHLEATGAPISPGLFKITNVIHQAERTK